MIRYNLHVVRRLPDGYCVKDLSWLGKDASKECHARYNLIELDNEGCRGRVGHDTSIVYIDEYKRVSTSRVQVCSPDRAESESTFQNRAEHGSGRHRARGARSFHATCERNAKLTHAYILARFNGWISDISRCVDEGVRSFCNNYYYPNNLLHGRVLSNDGCLVAKIYGATVSNTTEKEKNLLDTRWVTV